MIADSGDGDAALELLSLNAYDIAVLDRDTPRPQPRTRSPTGSSPPAAACRYHRADEKVTRFGLGADVKPFELQELVLRLRALDRRRATTAHRAGDRWCARIRSAAGSRSGRYVALIWEDFAVLEALVGCRRRCLR